MITRLASAAFIAAGFGTIAACSAGQPAPAADSTASASSTTHSAIDKMINHTLDRAQRELKTRDITLSGRNGAPDTPVAKITPQGDLLIADKPVALTAAQRADVLAYRKQLVEVGEQGIAVGKQGADLGMSAAGEALAAVFSGQSEQQVRDRVEAKASGIREAAAKICDRLPELMARQQQLAKVVPEFRPYATLTQAKINECRTNALKDRDDTSRAETSQSMRDKVRGSIRTGIQTATQGVGLASRNTGDADSAVSSSPAGRRSYPEAAAGDRPA